MDDLEQQVRVSKMLGLGFVLSIATIFGLGSFIAMILGWRALLIIRRSHGKISGRLMAWWCILTGALGTSILLFLGIVTLLE